MRRLLLLRHAKSDWSRPGQADHDRDLNSRGVKTAPVMGTYLHKHRLAPDLALVSSARRARRTWDLMAEALKDNVKSREEPRIYEAKPAALLDLIRATPDDVRSLLIVGHNPTLQALALELVGSGDVEARRRLAEKLPTAALVVIDFAGNGWSEVHRQGGRLDRFVTPATLVAIPD